MVHTLSGFYFLFSLFLARLEEKRERERNPFFSALLISFFPRRGCTDMVFHTGFCSATRNWRELYKNLTVLSSLDAYTLNQIQSKELKGPLTYLGNFRVNWTAYSLLIGISLTFQRQLWPENKPIFRSEYERKGTVPLSRQYLMCFF